MTHLTWVCLPAEIQKAQAGPSPKIQPTKTNPLHLHTHLYVNKTRAKPSALNSVDIELSTREISPFLPLHLAVQNSLGERWTKRIGVLAVAWDRNRDFLVVPRE